MTQGGHQTLERKRTVERPEIPEIMQEPHPHLGGVKKLGSMQDEGGKKLREVLASIGEKRTIGKGKITGVYVDEERIYLEGLGLFLKTSGSGSVELYKANEDGSMERIKGSDEIANGQEVHRLLIKFIQQRERDIQSKGDSDLVTDMKDNELAGLKKKLFSSFVIRQDIRTMPQRVDAVGRNRDKIALRDEEGRLIGFIDEQGNLYKPNEDEGADRVDDIETRSIVRRNMMEALSDSNRNNLTQEERRRLETNYDKNTERLEAVSRRHLEAVEYVEGRGKSEKRKKAAERERREQQAEQRKREEEAEQLLLEKPENILTLDPEVRRRMEKKKIPMLIKLYQERPDLHEKVRKAA